MFWLVENLILFNVLITGESNFDEKNVEELFNIGTLVTVKSTVEILQNFVAFSDYMNFIREFFLAQIFKNRGQINYAHKEKILRGVIWHLFLEILSLWDQATFSKLAFLKTVAV